MTNFEALLGALGQNQVEFIVVGGAAALAHGSARFTQDLDIVYHRSPENLRRLVAADLVGVVDLREESGQ